MNNRSLFDIGSGGSHYGEVPRDEALENQGDAGGSSRGRRRFVRKLLGQAVYIYIYIFRSGQTACECWPCPLISLVFWCPEREFNEHGQTSPLSDRSRIYIYIYSRHTACPWSSTQASNSRSSARRRRLASRWRLIGQTPSSCGTGGSRPTGMGTLNICIGLVPGWTAGELRKQAGRCEYAQCIGPGLFLKPPGPVAGDRSSADI